MALWALDLELGSVVENASEPMIAEIKLAWWREALARLDTAPPPAQPLLQALAAEVLPRGVTGAELSGLEDRWLARLTGEAADIASAVTPAKAGFHHPNGQAMDPRVRGGDDGSEAASRLACPDALTILAVRLLGNGKSPIIAALTRLEQRDAARRARGVPPEPRGSLGRQWIMFKTVALGR